VFSRYIVIALALAAAGMRMAQGAWIEATGLSGLAGGLIALRLAPRHPPLKRVAYLGFLVTAVTVVVVLVRRSRA
jgi:hypothetical protein